MTATVRPRQAAGLILIGMAVLGLFDNFVAFIADDSSLWQFHLVRGLIVLLALTIAAGFGAGSLMARNPWGVLGRSVFQAGAMVIYFGCITIMPIGVVVAGLFTAPLFVLIISVLVQGQSVGPVRWLAVVIGFLGAVLVIRPDPEALDIVAFLPVLAGLLYAIGAVGTRAWCEGEDTLTLIAWFFAILTLFGLFGVVVLDGGSDGGFAMRGWMPLTGVMIAWYLALAAGALVGIGCIIRAYQIGDASYVAIYEYALLIFASFWAWMIWGETLPLLAILGMFLIIGAGGVIALRADR